MNKVELINRTKTFTHRSVKLALTLPMDFSGKHIQRQLIRCSTSVAANLAQSTKSFIAKLRIVIEEADESTFWLEFIKDENLIKQEFLAPLLNESKELTSIFIASRKTLVRKVNNN